MQPTRQNIFLGKIYRMDKTGKQESVSPHSPQNNKSLPFPLYNSKWTSLEESVPHCHLITIHLVLVICSPSSFVIQYIAHIRLWMMLIWRRLQCNDDTNQTSFTSSRSWHHSEMWTVSLSLYDKNLSYYHTAVCVLIAVIKMYIKVMERLKTKTKCMTPGAGGIKTVHFYGLTKSTSNRGNQITSLCHLGKTCFRPQWQQGTRVTHPYMYIHNTSALIFP